MTDHTTTTRDGSAATGQHVMRVPRSRGAISGLILLVLGIWGAVIPFVGPYFGYAYTPNASWVWTAGRLWLEILPGVATIVGGFLLLTTANRAVAVFGGWLASAAGAWFVVGPILGSLWAGPEGAAGGPIGTGPHAVVEQIGFFYGLGVVIVFLAAQALGRFTVRAVRDVGAVQRRGDDRTQTVPPQRDGVTTHPAAGGGTATPTDQPVAERSPSEGGARRV